MTGPVELESGKRKAAEALPVHLFGSKRLIWVLPFILVFLVQLVHHQLWRDELNAWGIAAAASNLKVLYQYVRYEGHPLLWYAMLWPITKLTTAPEAMKVLEGCIGVAIYLVLALYSPFPRWQNILIAAGYFFSFEYTVPARMYSVTLLFLLLYLHGRTRNPEKLAINFLLLAVLANTDLVGLILSGALALEYLASEIFVKGNRVWKRKEGLQAALIYLLGLTTTVIALRISPHITWRDRPALFHFAMHRGHLVGVVASAVALPWFPIATPYPEHWWNVYLISLRPHPFYILATLVILVVYLLLLWQHRLPGMVVFVTIAGVVAVNHLVYAGSTRHYGPVFLAFLAALWLVRVQTGQTWPLGIPAMVLSALAGVAAAYGQWHHPFSQGEATARWLHKQGLDREVILTTPDTAGAAVGELLRKPFYALDCNCVNTFLLYSRDRDGFDIPDVPSRFLIARQKLGRSLFTLVTDYPIRGDLKRDLALWHIDYRQIASFTGAEEPQESYYVFRVNVLPQAGPPPATSVALQRGPAARPIDRP